MWLRIGQTLARSFITGPVNYLQEAMEQVQVIWGCLLAAICFILFPDQALLVSLLSVLGAAMLDIITRFLAMRSRGERGWHSDKLWEGTVVKLVAYLVIAFLAGLSYRLTPFLQQPTIYLWSVAYVVMFLREVQSNMENLAELGADVAWLRSWAKRKQRQILEQVDLGDDDEA
jgi:hypothetical protein